MNPKIDNYLLDGCGRCSLGATPECKVNNWREELRALRRIALDCDLTEELKWGVPCYTFQNKNIATVSALRDYCAVSFFKGVLIKDTDDILVKPGENSQSARYAKFTDVKDINRLEPILKTYFFQAIEVEKAGLKVNFKKNPEPLPQELLAAFDKDPGFKDAFDALTPGRRRGYILYFSAPKKSETRHSRIEKHKAQIFSGIGMHDKYR